jgi:hypothetical protein
MINIEKQGGDVYSTNLKRYIQTMRLLDNRDDLEDDEINRLEERLEDLFYELNEDEIIFIESKDFDLDIDFDEEN